MITIPFSVVNPQVVLLASDHGARDVQVVGIDGQSRVRVQACYLDRRIAELIVTDRDGLPILGTRCGSGCGLSVKRVRYDHLRWLPVNRYPPPSLRPYVVTALRSDAYDYYLERQR